MPSSPSNSASRLIGSGNRERLVRSGLAAAGGKRPAMHDALSPGRGAAACNHSSFDLPTRDDVHIHGGVMLLAVRHIEEALDGYSHRFRRRD